MATASASAPTCANFGTEQVFVKNPVAVRALAAVMQKLQDLYPKKFSANVAVRARVSTRAVDYWIAKDAAERREMGAEALLGLILSDAGGDVMDAIINSAPAKDRPRWATRYLNAVRMARIEEMQAEQDEEIKQLRLSLLK